MFRRFGYVEKRLGKKAMVDFKIQTGQQVTIIHILSNTSRSKGNQTIKFGHLIEHDMRNSFLEKPYTKYGGQAFLCKKNKIENSIQSCKLKRH